MLKLNISKAISMRPRKGPRNRGTKKGISSKGGRGSQNEAIREPHALSARAFLSPVAHSLFYLLPLHDRTTGRHHIHYPESERR